MIKTVGLLAGLLVLAGCVGPCDYEKKDIIEKWGRLPDEIRDGVWVYKKDEGYWIGFEFIQQGKFCWVKPSGPGYEPQP